MKFAPFYRVGLIVAVMIHALTATKNSLAADSVEELGVPRDVLFKAKLDATEQRYVIQLPRRFDPTRPHDLLIALHGHGSDRWQFVKDARGECRAARDAASLHQMIYVSPDYRARTSWMGPAAEADLLQIIDDLHQQYRLENIIVCGGSMGGTSALAFATLHPECVDGVVSLNGTANLVEYEGFAEAIAASYGGTKSEKPEVYKARSAELFPERLTMPVGLTTGALDKLVPPESTLRLAELLKRRESPVKLIHQVQGGHETSYDDSMEVMKFVIEKVRSTRESTRQLLDFGAKPTTIVCIGDSVTGVYYHTGGRRAYPEMLEIGLKQLFPNSPISVINAGISGQTTQDGLERLERDVLSKNPDLVTISFGLNDMTRIPPEKYRDNLELLINRCREHHCQVLLCTPNAVIDTASRPIEKLKNYCEIIRGVGRTMMVPVCDQYSAGARFRNHAPWAWRLTLSDEIHPNMDGHKRMAEELCRSIAAQAISLDSIGPPRPALPRVRSLLQQGKAIRVLAMPPYDSLIGIAIKGISQDANVEVTAWSTAGKTMLALEQEANKLVRSMKPDLVVLAVPREAAVDNDEQYVRSYSWIMNWSLSFGQQEWDCVVVHPSVMEPHLTGPRDELSRQLIGAQDLDVIDRTASDRATTTELFTDWFRKQFHP